MQLSVCSRFISTCLLLVLSDVISWQPRTISRRRLLEQTSGASLGVFLWGAMRPATAGAEEQTFATSAGRSNCVTTSDPSKTVVTCAPSLAKGSSVQGVAAAENGVSTAAIKNPSRYAPPWSYVTQTDNGAVAWKSLMETVKTVEPAVQVEAERVPTEDAPYYYFHGVVPCATLPGELDDIEFVLRPEDELVLFRSVSRTSLFIYPLTQPVSDRNSNLKRMQKIREKLGWAELGYPQTGSSFL